MNALRGTLLAVAACVLALDARAQMAAPEPAAAKPEEPCRTEPAPPVVARVGATEILLTEIDGALQDVLAGVRSTLFDARARSLEDAVDARVLALEAKARGLAPAELLRRELAGRWRLPTIEDARARYAALEKELTGGFALHQAAILEQLAQERETEARSAFLFELRPRHAVEPRARPEDLADPRLAPTTVIASVAGAAITLEELDAPLQPLPRLMEEELYEQRRRELDARIRARLDALPKDAPPPVIEVLLVPPRAGDARIAGADEPALGPADAAVTLVAFVDFECPNCAKLHAELLALRAAHEKELRVVLRDFPIREHPAAVPAALAAEGARAQGRYFDFAARLFHEQVAFGPETFQRHARELGLDVERFARDSSNEAARAALARDQQDALAVGVFSTPTVFVNGRRVLEHDRTALEDAIQGALRERKAPAAPR